MALLYAFCAATGCAVVGLLGAGAFNPDSGWALHSYALYEIFGIPGEIGVIVLPFLAIALVARQLLRPRNH
ncbi:MAG: hypothetical protein JWM71_1620 [Solirubrobacteraceae bacterium]|nr:hypothetical protein [Solirubrobacteraceae bacterium]